MSEPEAQLYKTRNELIIIIPLPIPSLPPSSSPPPSTPPTRIVTVNGKSMSLPVFSKPKGPAGQPEKESTKQPEKGSAKQKESAKEKGSAKQKESAKQNESAKQKEAAADVDTDSSSSSTANSDTKSVEDDEDNKNDITIQLNGKRYAFEKFARKNNVKKEFSCMLNKNKGNVRKGSLLEDGASGAKEVAVRIDFGAVNESVEKPEEVGDLLLDLRDVDEETAGGQETLGPQAHSSLYQFSLLDGAADEDERPESVSTGDKKKLSRPTNDTASIKIGKKEPLDLLSDSIETLDINASEQSSPVKAVTTASVKNPGKGHKSRDSTSSVNSSVRFVLGLPVDDEYFTADEGDVSEAESVARRDSISSVARVVLRDGLSVQRTAWTDGLDESGVEGNEVKVEKTVDFGESVVQSVVQNSEVENVVAEKAENTKSQNASMAMQIHDPANQDMAESFEKDEEGEKRITAVAKLEHQEISNQVDSHPQIRFAKKEPHHVSHTQESINTPQQKGRFEMEPPRQVPIQNKMAQKVQNPIQTKQLPNNLQITNNMSQMVTELELHPFQRNNSRNSDQINFIRNRTAARQNTQPPAMERVTGKTHPFNDVKAISPAIEYDIAVEESNDKLVSAEEPLNKAFKPDWTIQGANDTEFKKQKQSDGGVGKNSPVNKRKNEILGQEIVLTEWKEPTESPQKRHRGRNYRKPGFQLPPKPQKGRQKSAFEIAQIQSNRNHANPDAHARQISNVREVMLKCGLDPDSPPRQKAAPNGILKKSVEEVVTPPSFKMGSFAAPENQVNFNGIPLRGPQIQGRGEYDPPSLKRNVASGTHLHGNRLVSTQGNGTKYEYNPAPNHNLPIYRNNPAGAAAREEEMKVMEVEEPKVVQQEEEMEDLIQFD